MHFGNFRYLEMIYNHPEKERPMKIWYVAFFLALWILLSPHPSEAKVLSTFQKELYAVYIFAEERPPTTLGFVFTNFGPGNIKFLERLDIVLDKEGRVAGILVVYTPSDGFRRHVFFSKVSGWMLQEKRENSLGKVVTIRVITSDELNQIY